DDERLIVLLDPSGRALGVAPRSTVHHGSTPFHLAFSCHVVDAEGNVLLSRRAASKRTWPCVWTNACCGHPQPGESLRQAVTRHLADELGLVPTNMAIALPDFAYRATMDDGTVEHELCPVVVVSVSGDLRPNPDEVDDIAWMAWHDVVERARTRPSTLSPWFVTQIAELDGDGRSPADVLAAGVGATSPRVRTSVPATDLFMPIGEPLERELARVVEARCAELETLDPLATEIGEEIRTLIAAGGKRLRPAFVHWGHQLAGGGDDDSVVGAAVALELLHTFALIHDDVMDRSDVRRGVRTVHRAFADRHHSSDESFGTSAAIVAGDLVFVWAGAVLESLAIDDSVRRRVRTIYDGLRVEVIAGQYLDLRLAGLRPTTQQAVRVALLKSGRYTVTRPLQLGAALAGAPESVLDVLRRYGDAVGVAFQMRDDVLGVFGDPATTGKGADDDLRDGKATLLLLRAFEMCSAAEQRFLAGALGNPDLDDAAAAACRGIIASSGALASIERLIESKLDEARMALDHDTSTASDNLVALATALTARAG
ncbi:unnamed protein product, partial [Phaeothamnion confervicola]